MASRSIFKGKLRDYTPEYVAAKVGIGLHAARNRIQQANNGTITEAGILQPRGRLSGKKFYDSMTAERRRNFTRLDNEFLRSADKMDEYFPK